jgi:hypothetical protein
MAFLDNSGDIILDAVLTDAGRKRLARADGTFKIAKFALGDDEIDYGLYDKNNASGSAYYDLSLLQTPILEAFTNNTSILKSRLISIPQDNLLYLPVAKLSKDPNINSLGLSLSNTQDIGGLFYVTVDTNTEDVPNSSNIEPTTAIDSTIAPFTNTGGFKSLMYGFNTAVQPNQSITVDQGLDTTAIPQAQTLDTSLVENQYVIEIDNRLGSIISEGKQPAAISFIDDDNIASYYFSVANDAAFISSVQTSTTIAGPTGTRLKFLVKSSLDLQQSTYLFELLGGTETYRKKNGVDSTYYYIDSIVRVTGAQTGFSLDIPVRFLKYKSTP